MTTTVRCCEILGAETRVARQTKWKWAAQVPVLQALSNTPIQLLQNTLMDKLWHAHSSRYEIIMECNYIALRHAKQILKSTCVN